VTNSNKVESHKAADWEQTVIVGERVSVAKTVSETDVYLFAGITGDLHPNHVDAEYMKAGRFGQRLVHGALLVGFMSTASTRFMEQRALDGVSLGYDRIRFIAPAHFGDTLTVDYVIEKVDHQAQRSWAKIEVRNQEGKLVAVGTHIMKYIR
jgi:acyl dehydratase